MRLLQTFALRKLKPANAGCPVIELLLKISGVSGVPVGMTREQAVALVADLSQALEPEADTPDAGGIRVG